MLRQLVALRNMLVGYFRIPHSLEFWRRMLGKKEANGFQESSWNLFVTCNNVCLFTSREKGTCDLTPQRDDKLNQFGPQARRSLVRRGVAGTVRPSELCSAAIYSPGAAFHAVSGDGTNFIA